MAASCKAVRDFEPNRTPIETVLQKPAKPFCLSDARLATRAVLKREENNDDQKADAPIVSIERTFYLPARR